MIYVYTYICVHTYIYIEHLLSSSASFSCSTLSFVHLIIQSCSMSCVLQRQTTQCHRGSGNVALHSNSPDSHWSASGSPWVDTKNLAQHWILKLWSSLVTQAGRRSCGRTVGPTKNSPRSVTSRWAWFPGSCTSVSTVSSLDVCLESGTHLDQWQECKKFNAFHFHSLSPHKSKTPQCQRREIQHVFDPLNELALQTNLVSKWKWGASLSKDNAGCMARNPSEDKVWEFCPSSACVPIWGGESTGPFESWMKEKKKTDEDTKNASCTKVCNAAMLAPARQKCLCNGKLLASLVHSRCQVPNHF